MRRLLYHQAINEALHQLIERDPRVFLIGQGVTSPWYVGRTTVGLIHRFGPKRIIDTPVSENSITGIAIGAALAGMRPILVHPRMDFMYYAMDQLANHAATWRYMFGNQFSIPLTIWGIVNRGGGQAAQHSQSLQAIFMHIPGFKIVMPSTPYDAKGLLVSAVEDNNPVLYIDDRWLYNCEGEVPEDLYKVPIGKGIVRREGKDVTLAATSYMVVEALKAAKVLEGEGIDIEVIDIRSLKPLDKEILINSVKKTGRFIIVDGGWRTCGVSAEILSIITTEAYDYLKAPALRLALPDVPAPASPALEKVYYLNSEKIIVKVRELMSDKN